MNVIRVIFHVSDADKWPVALANVQNLLHAASDVSSDVHLLANSGAVAFLNQASNQEQLQRMHNLTELGAQFLVCANSLKGHGISQDEVPEWMTIVPVGVLTLIDRQSQGFAYIKP